MGEFGTACLHAFHRRSQHFRSHSALFWQGPDRAWEVLQKEGYAASCLDRGSRFYWVDFLSTNFRTDFGLCAPSVCSQDEIQWALIPELYSGFFGSIEDQRYGVALREYRAYDLARARAETAPWTVTIAGGLLFLALLGVALWLAGAFANKAARENGQERVRATLHGLVWFGWQLVLAGISLREVGLFTRWMSYSWHLEHEPVLAWSDWAGRSVLEVLPWLQASTTALLVAGSRGTGSGLKSWFALYSRAVFTALWLLILTDLVQPALTMNHFSKEGWYRPSMVSALVSCVNLPSGETVPYLLLGAQAADEGAATPSSTSSREVCAHFGLVIDQVRLCLLLLAPLAAHAAIRALGHCCVRCSGSRRGPSHQRPFGLFSRLLSGLLWSLFAAFLYFDLFGLAALVGEGWTFDGRLVGAPEKRFGVTAPSSNLFQKALSCSAALSAILIIAFTAHRGPAAPNLEEHSTNVPAANLGKSSTNVPAPNLEKGRTNVPTSGLGKSSAVPTSGLGETSNGNSCGSGGGSSESDNASKSKGNSNSQEVEDGAEDGSHAGEEGFPAIWATMVAATAVPAIVHALEGYAEPHAKFFSKYDLFVRVAGVAIMAKFLGTTVEVSYRAFLWLASCRAGLGISLSGPNLEGKLKCEVNLVLAGLAASLAYLSFALDWDRDALVMRVQELAELAAALVFV